jgi:hypothetical protein
MPKKSSKKQEGKVSDVEIYEEDGWYVKYTGTHGKKNIMKLDAVTYKDAKFEASSLLDVPEDQIEN